jgi:amino acid transporter
MQEEVKPTLSRRVKEVVIGPPVKLDSKVFHRLSLIALFAWVGLGADGLSSSSYGPEEAFLALQSHPYLGVFVALATAVTIFVIGASYIQIIELFPSGGGGYVVASKLLSPRVGMVAGSALLIDYALTITVSVAAGADALFSLIPVDWIPWKIWVAVIGVALLTLLNMRGVRESVTPLIPIFIIFIITHVFIIGYAVYANWENIPAMTEAVDSDVRNTSAELGLWGMVFLILRAYSMGAGTYTGLEAVSNGIPLLRDPKVQTAKRTMTYMMVSLAFTACGLMLAYLLYNIGPQHGKTLNAVLLSASTGGWGEFGGYFVLVTLVSEAALLFVAAQTGFLGGPRVLANMALDSWVPKRFALLSDRFVNQNGILIMGCGALSLMVLTGGSVKFLVVLYSINVFITFFLSQLGIMRYLWYERVKVRDWYRKVVVGLTGLILTLFILVSVTVIKFNEGGWMTLLITGMFIGVALTIKRHYDYTARLIRKLDDSVLGTGHPEPVYSGRIIQNLKASGRLDRQEKTAAIFVDGFNGLGLHTLANVLRLGGFRNFVFVQVGRLDAGTFKGASEVERLEGYTKAEIEKYVNLMKRQGYFAEGMYSIGNDVVDEVDRKIAPNIMERFPNTTFFGGHTVFSEYSFLMRLLHNYTVFAMQRKLYGRGIPFVLLPIKV